MDPAELGRIVRDVQVLSAELRRQLSTIESSGARAITLDTSYASLAQLSVKQDDLFRQALRCVESKLYRAAHVMAWAAALDFVHQRLAADLQVVQQLRSAWNVNAVEDLRSHSDYQVIDLAGACGAFTKGEVKAFHGLLHRRNECAHPEDVYPGLNESLGYIEELFKRLLTLQKRSWP